MIFKITATINTDALVNQIVNGSPDEDILALVSKLLDRMDDNDLLEDWSQKYFLENQR